MLHLPPRLALLLTLSATAAALACGDAGGGQGAAPISTRVAAITDGVEDTGHRSVGYLAAGDEVGCTGTVVGPRTVLTAGHCISGESQILVLDGARYASSSSVIHPGYDPVTHLDDIGVLRLELPVHVVPSALAPKPRATGSSVTMVGFGATSEGAADFGTKYRAANTIKSLHTTSFNIAGTGGGKGNVCHRDSGAPVFEGALGSGPQIGVIIGGVPPCGSVGIAVRVDVYLSWLRDNTRVSGLAVLGEPGTFGMPCTTGQDCTGGICQLDQASGDRFCSLTCSADDACPGGGACAVAGRAAATCQLPPPPEDDTGCAVGSGARAVPRGGLVLLGALALLLGVARPRSRPR